MLKVRDRMVREVERVRLDQEVHELEELCLPGAIHEIPVVDLQDRIVGVVTQANLLAWHYENLCADPEQSSTGRLHQTRVAELMSPRIHCIGPERPLTEAAGRMVRERILHLFVIDENYAVIGLLSASDLLGEIPGVLPRSA